MSLSEKLQQLRRKHGWSQEYVSKVLKMDRSMISRYETGKNVPTYQTVLQFSDMYKVDKEYLVSELDQMIQTGQAPYILKESETGSDPEIEIICQLAKNEKLVKDVFLELHLLDEKTRTAVLRATQAFMKEIKKRY
ncbi:helix-turn-helix domain-containing protein [Bacillus sp. CGMCC 1.16607]|uniref:helix-turn-helix domain-containing protein n=1 Tax=Bacillus sp. CGMCC 1.16607 TaxID=3351842 RepID=UPI00362AFF14